MELYLRSSRINVAPSSDVGLEMKKLLEPNSPRSQSDARLLNFSWDLQTFAQTYEKLAVLAINVTF